MDSPDLALISVLERIKRACGRSGRDPGEVTIIGVTKGHPKEIRRKARALGLRHLGENRVQEAFDKYGDGEFLREENRPSLHLIGHLQSNKAKAAVRLFDSVDSLDRQELATALDRMAGDAGKRLRVLIQVNTSGEAQKSGIRPEQAIGVAKFVKELKNLDLRGFMTIGPLVGDERAIRASFAELRRIRECASAELSMPELAVLSMGMSDDFEWAIEEGATEIRLGTILWGPRQV
ncbi:MAG: YggS family pyridoxal phosphate-dependent enzyme [bacterium]|nr:YggS family pyridoxal phosphate-dependent enzyme [bacterium]